MDSSRIRFHCATDFKRERVSQEQDKDAPRGTTPTSQRGVPLTSGRLQEKGRPWAILRQNAALGANTWVPTPPRNGASLTNKCGKR